MASLDRPAIEVILVPAGAEYQAVQRAIKRVQNSPQVVAIPAGPEGVARFLRTWEDPPDSLLLIGLGGSLSPQFKVGDSVLLEQLTDGGSGQVYGCDRTLTAQVSAYLKLPMIKGISCDRIITTAIEKNRLRESYGSNIVEMEGAALLKGLPHCQIVVVRVISDGCHHDLPDIANAIGPDGAIKPLVMAISFLRRPVAALRLIQGSLKGLNRMETIVFDLFKED